MKEAILAVIAIAAFGLGSVALADDRDRVMDQDRLQDRDRLHLCAASSDAPLELQTRMRIRNELRAMIRA